ncbi:hypothetical protein HPB48_012947 [Haemaphysalis longicornis]|uniref:Uncharacterized protein n=1 Tax=Haemaphysalis longicornis TaxID=44386 RepID=A0A9J6F6X8_HAELO|nr:hypothetical protein HPB48_012947 [Haemaphysalis longicornis]
MEQLKAKESLDAHNYLTSGFVQRVLLKVVHDHIEIVVGKLIINDIYSQVSALVEKTNKGASSIYQMAPLSDWAHHRIQRGSGGCHSNCETFTVTPFKKLYHPED